MQKEKVRLYLIAREIDVDSKDLVDLCKSQGWDVKNQLSSIEPEQRDILVQMIKAGGSRAAAAPPAAPVRPAIPTPPRPVRPLITPKPAAPPKAEPEPVQKAPAAPEPDPAAAR